MKTTESILNTLFTALLTFVILQVLLHPENAWPRIALSVLAVILMLVLYVVILQRKKAEVLADDWRECCDTSERAYEAVMSRLKKMHLAAEECDMDAVDKILGNVVVMDLETSGLHPRKHGVLSIGAVKVLTGETFCAECRLDEDRTFEAKALAVNGRKQETLWSTDYEEVREARQRCLDWLGVSPTGGRWMMSGENVGKHDYWFFREIRTSPSQPDMDGVLQHRTLDLHTLAVACSLAGIFAMPERGWSADRIFEACGLGAEPKPHGPLTGAQMSADALRIMARKLAGKNKVSVPTSLDGLPNTLFGVGNFPEGSTLMESGRHTPRTGEPKADTLANFQAADHKLV